VGGDALTIDGSQGEGGGQVLRTSLALAAALRDRGGPASLRIVNIRARRPRPGLQPQHLAAVRAAAEVCGGALTGAARDSTELTFRPGAARAGAYRFDIGTAGSATLVCQTVLPALLCADGDSEVTVSGGTHNPFAPCFEYLRDVFGTLAEAAGASFASAMARMGFYPAGGGEVTCRIRGVGGGAQLGGVKLLTRGEPRAVEGLSAAAEALPAHIVRRQADRAAERLRGEGLPVAMRRLRGPARSPGTVVFLRAIFSRGVAGSFALGKRGKPAERVADEAVDDLLAFLAAPGATDPHAADQLITLLALAPGASELTTTAVTGHLLTNAEVVRQVAGRAVTVEGAAGEPGRVLVPPAGS